MSTASTLRVLGIPGSLRQGSYNHAALRAARELAPDGMEIEIAGLASLPPFNEDDEPAPPEAVLRLRAAVSAADAILFATPEYNYSIPGVLKNAIDWASRPYGQGAWMGKPAAIIGASTGGFGAARAHYHLRQIMVGLDMYPLNGPEIMIGTAHEKFDGTGRLADQATRDLMALQLQALRDWVYRLRTPERRAAAA